MQYVKILYCVFFKRAPLGMRKGPSWHAKGPLLACERTPLGMRKDPSWKSQQKNPFITE